jgi:hypothetical protein
VPWGKSSRAVQTRQDHCRTRQVTPLPCYCVKTGVGRRTSDLGLRTSSFCHPERSFSSRGARSKDCRGTWVPASVSARSPLNPGPSTCPHRASAARSSARDDGIFLFTAR